ncbi:uncharacterized protein RCC_11327 [Ramularia collo-cygni]|uniref:Uncharacterized protein n=1 Tax=Ramularia collo-cygni TaxID=112498 RepID=A0A2D3VBX1_9PEZI|nr:uncharacterized protein RCC_11327 [Ramularia collo-cygni]CZT25658.1 uncharacterized protein RCC_11327 [Ramularia collo-cygni]
MNSTQSYQPLKAFEVTKSGTFTTRHLQLRQNGETILWINTHSGFMQPTQINLQMQSQNGPTVAAVRLKRMSSGCRVMLGSPDGTDREQWQDVESQSLSGKRYGFQYQGTSFAWKRTHKKEFGASGWGRGGFKFVQASKPDEILAVYITDRKWFNNTDIARIEFMTELGREVELMALAAMLGIAEHIRRANRASSGGGGGGGGGC